MAHPSLIMPAYGKCVGTLRKLRRRRTRIRSLSVCEIISTSTHVRMTGHFLGFRHRLQFRGWNASICNEEAHWLVDKVTSHRWHHSLDPLPPRGSMNRSQPRWMAATTSHHEPQPICSSCLPHHDRPSNHERETLGRVRQDDGRALAD
jgi:hypothetical protein